MRRIGVVGSMVWDEIHGRDPAAPPVEEWGGIAYALAALDAALPAGWEIVPMIKVGRDRAAAAHQFLASLERRAPTARFVEVPAPTNRVVLRYQTSERRCEQMAGGVPPWTWPELGPMVRDLDALYLNFISGFELGLDPAVAMRRAFAGPVYADLHSLLLSLQPDGHRQLRPLPDAAAWLGCFDVVQVNEDEMAQLGSDPMRLVGDVLDAGVSLLIVTLGRRGAVYVAAPGVSRLADRRPGGVRASTPRPESPGRTARTARVEAAAVDAVDPTGCGDVFGATVFASLLGGAEIAVAVQDGNRAAAKNAAYRGATGLAGYLRGSLVTP
jgi:sugar/nucleoside kinase (ribokinase family)